MYFTQWGVSLFEGVAKFVLCRKTLALHAGVTWSPFFVYTLTSVWRFLKEVLSTSNGSNKVLCVPVMLKAKGLLHIKWPLGPHMDNKTSGEILFFHSGSLPGCKR